VVITGCDGWMDGMGKKPDQGGIAEDWKNGTLKKEEKHKHTH
jgi:hypothetical protein